MISGGDSHIIALDEDGYVWTWGNNENGQLGNGTTVNSATPVQVIKSDNEALSNIVYVDGGFMHSMAIDANGDLWVWGRNSSCELGLGNSYNGVPKAQKTVFVW
jgi:alpha-tubulin suppressor-like RCC1 family protein